jgi:hypothetical protein
MNNKIEQFTAYLLVSMTVSGFSWLLYCMLATYMKR